MLVNLTNKTRYLQLDKKATPHARVPAIRYPLLTDKDAQYLGQYHRALTRRWQTCDATWGCGKRIRLMPIAEQLLPLVYNHRKEDELKRSKGAVLHTPPPHDSWRTLWVIVDDDQTMVPWASVAHEGEQLDEPPIDECQLIGCLPTQRLVDLFRQQKALYMEDIENDYFETKYTRGPRIEVIHHTLDLSDIDPANDPLDRLKQVAMPLVLQILNDHDIDIRQISNDNPNHETAMRLLLAAYKHGVLDLPRITPLQNMDCYRLVTTDNWVTRDKRPLFIHPNPDDPRLVRFYNGYADLLRGRVSTAKPGKLVGRMMEGYNEENIKQVTNRVQMEILPSTFEIIDDPVRIRDAYLKGPSSCASKPWYQYSRLKEYGRSDLHPTMVYGSTPDNPSDTALAVCWKGDMPVCRAVISRHSMQYPRIYFMDDCQTAWHEFKTWLAEQGYSLSENALVGSVIRHVPFGPADSPDERPHLLMPYIDIGGKSVHHCLKRRVSIVSGLQWTERLSPLAKELLARPVEDGTPKQLYDNTAAYDAGAVDHRHLRVNSTPFETCAITGALIFNGNGVLVLMPDGTRAACAPDLTSEHVFYHSNAVAARVGETADTVHASLREQVLQAPTLSQHASTTLLGIYGGPVSWIGDPGLIENLIEYGGIYYERTELVEVEGNFYFPHQVVCWKAPDGTRHVAVGRHLDTHNAVALQNFINKATAGDIS